MNEKEYSISLRVWHPTIAGDDLASLIERPTFVVQNVGKPRVTRKGKVLDRVNDQSYCVFDLLDHGKGVFVEGIESLMPDLLRMEKTLKMISDTGGVAELYVFLFPEEDINLGFTLEADIVSALSALRLQLSVDLLLLEPDN